MGKGKRKTTSTGSEEKKVSLKYEPKAISIYMRKILRVSRTRNIKNPKKLLNSSETVKKKGKNSKNLRNVATQQTGTNYNTDLN